MSTPRPASCPPLSPQALLSPNATVLRDGQAAVLPAESLVPGDVVLLKSGDKVRRRRGREEREERETRMQSAAAEDALCTEPQPSFERIACVPFCQQQP